MALFLYVIDAAVSANMLVGFCKGNALGERGWEKRGREKRGWEIGAP